MTSHRGLLLIAQIVGINIVALAAGGTEAGAGPGIRGVWSCEGARPGSTILRPVIFVFHSDGTFTYSSQSTVNGGSLPLPFTSRGGGHGEWEKVGPKDYAFRARENLYINGNAGGFYYVDSVQRFDPKTDQLCSGCGGTETKIRITQFIFDTNGNITSETVLVDTQAATACVRLNTVLPDLP